MKIKSIELSKLIPYARNPRINQATVSKVAASLHEFGWQQPIVVDADMVIIVGHTRFTAAQQLGLTHAPVHIAADLSPTQAKAYRIADNKTNDFSEWDYPLLTLEMQDIESGGLDLGLTGFDASELDWILHADEVAEDGEWKDMPEFGQEDKTSFRRVLIHFADQAAVDKFAKLLKQTITDKTKSLWFPPAVIDSVVNERY